MPGGLLRGEPGPGFGVGLGAGGRGMGLGLLSSRGRVGGFLLPGAIRLGPAVLLLIRFPLLKIRHQTWEAWALSS